MADRHPARTPGQALRQERERRGIDLPGAEEGTKIPLRLLEAIERDDYQQLSGPLYIKSFLRNYATWLELEAGEVLALYDATTGRPESSPAGGPDQVWAEDEVAVRRMGIAWGRLTLIAVAAAVALAILAVLGWKLLGGGDDAPEDLAPSRHDATPEVTTVVEAPVVEPESAGEPAGDAPAAVGQPPVPEPAAADAPAAVRPEIQPDDRGETAAERLARLSRDHLHDGHAEQPARAAAVPPAPARQDAKSADTDLAPPPRGDDALRFAGGEQFPLVLRVVLPEPANCKVRRDDAADVPVVWPEAPTSPPAYNLRHGTAYAIYWGAADHFTVTLERVRGASVTLNGEPMALDSWRPGQTKLLDGTNLAGGR
jgi:cytoskeleton protein RodZ